MTTSTKSRNPKAPDVSKARALVQVRGLEHRAAVDAEAALNARLEQGDDSVSVTNLTDAAAAIRRAGALLDSSREALNQAEAAASRATALAHPDIAEAIAVKLTDHRMELGIYGFAIDVVDEVPTTLPAAVPAIIVCQTKATTHDGLVGTVGGECVAYLIADKGAPLDVTTVLHDLRGLAESSFDVEFGSLYPRGGMIDYGNGVVGSGKLLQVKGLKPRIPVIAAEPQPFRIAALGPIISSAVIEAVGVSKEAGVHIGAGNAGARKSAVHCVADKSPALRNTSTDSDGVMRRVYTLGVSVTSQALEVERLQSSIVAGVERLAGTFVAGVGRVQTASLEDLKPIPRGREATVRLVLVSRAA